MGQTKVGSIAKQAVLTALSMKDPRVETFVVSDTNLLDNVITELCRKYHKSLDVWAAGDAKPSHDVKAAFDAFSKVLRFACALHQLCCGGSFSVAPGSPRASNLDTFTINDVPSPTTPNFSVSYSIALAMQTPSSGGAGQAGVRMKSEIVLLFRDMFLDVCHRTAVTHNSEQQVLAVQLLLRSMLQTLHASRWTIDLNVALPSSGGDTSFLAAEPSLHEIAANYFIGNGEFMAVVLSRVGAMSKAVVVSALQLLSDLMAGASLSASIEFVLGSGSRSPPSTPKKLSGPSSEDLAGRPSAPEIKSANAEINSILFALISKPLVFSYQSLPGTREFRGQCLQFEFLGVPPEYVSAALRLVTSRLSASVTLHAIFGQGGDGLDSISLDRASIPSQLLGSVQQPIMEIIFKKLGTFLHLKYEEQVTNCVVLPFACNAIR
jgi:hypothetical protein